MSNKHNAPLVPKLRFPQFREADEWNEKSGNSLFDQISDKKPDSGLPVLAITQEHGAIPRHLIDYTVSVTEKSIESYKVVQVGDFIISLRSFQGGVEYSQYHGICSPAYVVLRRRGEGSDVYFKQYLKTDRFIQILTKNLEGLRDGKMISYKQFSALRIPTPTAPEQQKIADCLSSLDELIAAQARKVDALKTHKKGLMQQLFTREGDTQPRLRFPEFQDARAWEELPLSKFFSHMRNGFVGIATPHYEPNGIPYLQGKNIKAGRIDPTNLVTISKTFHEKQRKSQLRVGDILMVQSGHVGECAVVDEEFAGGNCHALIVMSPESRTSSLFFVQYFYAPQGLDKIASVKTGNTITHILATDLRAMAVCVPGLEEQQRIAEFLTSLGDLIAIGTQELDVLKTHKKGLMQQLFPAAEAVEA